MKIAFLTSEATPFVKVGGLADVAGELPRHIGELDQDIRVFLPYYPVTQLHGRKPKKTASVSVPHVQEEEEINAFEVEWAGVRFYLLDYAQVRGTNSIYTEPVSDAEKFTLFALGALKVCEALNWPPDILHANDWHTAAAIVWLANHRARFEFWNETASVFSIHNLPYMGAGTEQVLASFDLPASDDPRLPDWARQMPLPMALSAADWLVTVSPNYAHEIQTSAYGCGLEGILEARSKRLVGIMNGIDPHLWDPATDSALPVNFSSEWIEPRAEVKLALRAKLGLESEDDAPLLCMITRLDRQKGVDIALSALETILEEPWQFILLGSGSEEIEAQVRTFAERYPQRTRMVLRFDSGLARRVYAGADMILLPSRYEPAGLAQLIAMTYGCVPVARATGGLKDAVIPYAPAEGTGFLFEEPEPDAMVKALRDALQVYRDPGSWKRLQLRGMRQDHSWKASASRYLEVYRKASQERAS